LKKGVNNKSKSLHNSEKPLKDVKYGTVFERIFYIAPINQLKSIAYRLTATLKF